MKSADTILKCSCNPNLSLDVLLYVSDIILLTFKSLFVLQIQLSSRVGTAILVISMAVVLAVLRSDVKMIA